MATTRPLDYFMELLDDELHRHLVEQNRAAENAAGDLMRHDASSPGLGSENGFVGDEADGKDSVGNGATDCHDSSGFSMDGPTNDHAQSVDPVGSVTDDLSSAADWELELTMDADFTDGVGDDGATSENAERDPTPGVGSDDAEIDTTIGEMGSELEPLTDDGFSADDAGNDDVTVYAASDYAASD